MCVDHFSISDGVAKTEGRATCRFEDVTCAVPSSRFTRSHWGASGTSAAPVVNPAKGSAGAGAPVREAEEGLVELQPRTNGCSEREMMFPHARGDPRALKVAFFKGDTFPTWKTVRST